MPVNAEYWERRYRLGGTSGDGSRGPEAVHKSTTVNALLERHGVRSVLDLGCGDGVVASMLSRSVPYIGYEPAATARARCEAMMPARCFVASLAEKRADLTLSLDVIFHLTTDADYREYLGELFGRADRFALVYGWQKLEKSASHVRHRLWLADVPPDWRLAWTQEGPFKDWWLFEASPR